MTTFTILLLVSVSACFAVSIQSANDDELSDLLASYIDARDANRDVNSGINGENAELLAAFVDALENPNTDRRQMADDDDDGDDDDDDDDDDDGDDDDDDDDDDERSVAEIMRRIQSGEDLNAEQRGLMKRRKWWGKVKSWWARSRKNAWKFIKALGKAAACRTCGKKRERGVEKRDWAKLVKQVACAYCSSQGRR